uniref:Zeta toxin domain-containing protein n=1 Tax=Eutreptiella gymnastica TaxID=73025 RepID=A0A7S4CQI9_9EUGL
MAATEFWRTHGNMMVIIEADAFKMQDPLFNVLLGAGVGNASEIVHGTSTCVAEELLLDALLSRRDIVFDGTLSWAPFVQQTVAMVRGTSTHQYQRGPGYRKGDDGLVREEYWTRKEELPVACIPYLVEMVGVTVNPEVAVQRGIVRQIISGRGVPITSQLQSHKMYSANFESYLDLFDASTLLDNNHVSAKTVAAKGSTIMAKEDDPKELQILDPEAYATFLRKQYINPDACGSSDLYTDA